MKINDFIIKKFRDMGFEEHELKEEISDLNLNSLEKVDLILSIQEEYDVMVDLSELENMSITSLEKYIARRL